MKNRTSASKNAFVLLGKHRHELAAAFFILGELTGSTAAILADAEGGMQGLVSALHDSSSAHGSPSVPQLEPAWLLSTWDCMSGGERLKYTHETLLPSPEGGLASGLMNHCDLKLGFHAHYQYDSCSPGCLSWVALGREWQHRQQQSWLHHVSSAILPVCSWAPPKQMCACDSQWQR